MRAKTLLLCALAGAFLFLISCSDADSGADNSGAGGTTSTINANGHEYVDLGLSVMWATCNLGADTPSDCGDYFAWGEIATKDTYTSSNSSTYGVSMGDIAGDADYDAARAVWGGTWRLPTKSDVDELVDECEWELTELDGHTGYEVTGPSGNSIFIPQAGWCRTSVLYVNQTGNYWTSTPYSSGSNNAYDLYFNSSRVYTDNGNRYTGQPIRPVIERGSVSVSDDSYTLVVEIID